MATKQVAGQLTKGVRTFFLPHQPQIVSQWAHTINWIPAIDLRSAIWTLWWDRSLRNSFRANNWDQEWLGQLVCRSLIPPEIRQWWVEVSRLQSRLSGYNTKHAENHYILKHVIKKWKCEKKIRPKYKNLGRKNSFFLPPQTPVSGKCLSTRSCSASSCQQWCEGHSSHFRWDCNELLLPERGRDLTRVHNRRAHFYFCF